jgi:hypothetical protein
MVKNRNLRRKGVLVLTNVISFTLMMKSSLMFRTFDSSQYFSDIRRLKEGLIHSNNVSKFSSAFHDQLKTLEGTFRFFQHILPANKARPLNSDTVELRHCHLEQIDYVNYTKWAGEILRDAQPNFKNKIAGGLSDVTGFKTSDWEDFLEPEMALGLLEMYATHHGNCDFNRYPLEISADLSNASKIADIPLNKELPRFVMVIVAYKDATHLKRLVRAIHLSHHIIVIHLERVTPLKFEQQVYDIATDYDNVLVVKFGTVAYRTDSVSMINYQIMNWIVNKIRVHFDYYFTLDGSAFPLYTAIELAKHLRNTHREIWLGQLLYKGKVLVDDNIPQWGHLMRKRLIFTGGWNKYQQRTKKSNTNGFKAVIPSFVLKSMTKKAVSGNQAVFSYNFVKKLTMSAEVKELFAIAKYSCCCCLEERTWIAAARIIGYGDMALDVASMFQLWGGSNKCVSTMNNAILSLNSTLCYRTEDATAGSLALTISRNEGDAIYIKGDQVFAQLKDAKRRGFLFARKFDSEDQGCLHLLEMIEHNLHR